MSPKKKQTKRGIKLDKKLVAPVPKNKSTWMRNPNRYDWPGIDLPAKQKQSSIPTNIKKQIEKNLQKRYMSLKKMQPGRSKKSILEGMNFGYQDLGRNTPSFSRYRRDKMREVRVKVVKKRRAGKSVSMGEERGKIDASLKRDFENIVGSFKKGII